MSQRPELTFLGTGSCYAGPYNDTASYLLDGGIMVDVGWHATQTLRRAGSSPDAVRHVLFTHLHHDHTMAFPALLFEYYMRRGQGLRVYGTPDIQRLLDDSDAFLRKETYWPDRDRPELCPLSDGERIAIGDYEIAVMDSAHAIPGFCYRFHHVPSGVDIGFTGDTAYTDALPAFFKGCRLLVHEFSWGAQREKPNLPRHSDAGDAAKVAELAGVEALCLVHGPTAERAACEAVVRRRYSGRLIWPAPNMKMLL